MHSIICVLTTTPTSKHLFQRPTSISTPKNYPTSKEIIQKLTAYESSTSNLFPKQKHLL